MYGFCVSVVGEDGVLENIRCLVEIFLGIGEGGAVMSEPQLLTFGIPSDFCGISYCHMRGFTCAVGFVAFEHSLADEEICFRCHCADDVDGAGVSRECHMDAASGSSENH